MNGYLVESHLRRYYILSLDPKIIEETCQQCFDSDRILHGKKTIKNRKIAQHLCGGEVTKEIYNNYLEDTQLENKSDIEEDLYYIFSPLYDVVNDSQKSNIYMKPQPELSMIILC